MVVIAARRPRPARRRGPALPGVPARPRGPPAGMPRPRPSSSACLGCTRLCSRHARWPLQRSLRPRPRRPAASALPACLDPAHHPGGSRGCQSGGARATWPCGPCPIPGGKLPARERRRAAAADPCTDSDSRGPAHPSLLGFLQVKAGHGQYPRPDSESCNAADISSRRSQSPNQCPKCPKGRQCPSRGAGEPGHRKDAGVTTFPGGHVTTRKAPSAPQRRQRQRRQHATPLLGRPPLPVGQRERTRT